MSTSANHATPGKGTASRWRGRRGLLKGVGASALATAAVVFGKPDQAAAHGVHRACFHLVLQPTDWSRCANPNNWPSPYIWSCTHCPVSHCCMQYQCCEAPTPTGTVWASAYRVSRGC
jgi:hypothetical protein